MKTTIVGLGLIGGSFGLAMPRKPGDEITGWDSSKENLDQALELGIVDMGASSLEEALEAADAIYLAIPVDQIVATLPMVMDGLQPSQFVCDFGSTKLDITRAVNGHPKRGRYLAAHPIAGTEYSGPGAAFRALYNQKVMIICEEELTDKDVVKHFESICQALSMKTVYLSSEDHDRHLAYVSHLSHVIAYGLSNTVLEEEKGDNRILELAGSGFESTVRLAKSSPEMWVPIFLQNRVFLLEGLDNYLNDLQTFKTHLEGKDHEALIDFLAKGRKIRKILK